MPDTKTEELQTFVRVAKLGSFAGAARELGLSTSGVSKQVSALEERLGVRLLTRTTRSVALTEAGQAFLARGEQVLEELEALEEDVRGRHRSLRGTLRVSAPQDYGRFYLCQVIGRFAGEFPELRIEFELTDRFVDVVEERFDVAIRLRAEGAGQEPGHRLGFCERVLCASPQYLDQYGTPEDAAALEGHNCIEYEHLVGDTWNFVEGSKTVRIRPSGRLRANAGWAMREMALAHQGIALLPFFLVSEDLEEGALVGVLPDSLRASMELRAVVPSEKQLSAKAGGFIDFLSENVQREPGFQSETR